MKLVCVTGVLAAATLLLFIATFLVALKTNALAKDTVAGNNLADVHHRQSMAPLLAVISYSSIDWSSGTLSLRVKNIGPGPTGICKLAVTKYENEDVGKMVVDFGPLASMEETQGYVQCPLGGVPFHHTIAFELQASNLFNEVVTTTWQGMYWPGAAVSHTITMTELKLP